MLKTMPVSAFTPRFIGAFFYEKYSENAKISRRDYPRFRLRVFAFF